MSQETLGIVGSGAIATGLGRAAAETTPFKLWARSDASAERARKKLDGAGEVTTDLSDLADSTIVVEAVAEDMEVKVPLLAQIDGIIGEDALLASTTSSLSVTELALGSNRPDRFGALHVFNPVHKMKLIELAFPEQASEGTRERLSALCETLGKTAVAVPDSPGFVVNRLLFPYLFDAVTVMEDQQLEPDAVDTCMKLGAGHPMGPLALLDFVGLDVSTAIADQIGVDVPQRVRDMVEAGTLGFKSGQGFYEYPPRG